MSNAALGYRVSLLTYLFLLLLDTLRPLFVSSVFSVHLLLIPVAYFAWRWSLEKHAKHHSVLDGVFLVTFGLVAGIAVWAYGEVFGDLRLFLALSVAALPCLALRGLHKLS